MKNVLLLASILALLSASISTPVLAQRSDNPNLKNFYMARQQIQITDDAPTLNDMRTNPAAAAQQGGAPAAGAGAAAAGQGLPRAGFMSNMGAYRPPAGAGLPKANNRVPGKLPETANGLNNGLKAGNAGKLKIKSTPGVKQQAPVVARSYKPYATTPVAQSGGSSGSSLNSSTSVQGSVLHWNRHH